jgi:hypothetical protein
LLYIARSSEKLGKLVEAREAYLKIQRESLKPTAPAAFREAQAAANKELPRIEPRLATVTLKLDGATAQEASVTVNGQPISAALVGLPTPSNPGDHVFEAKAPGRLPASQRVKLAEGAKQTVTLALQVDPNAAGAPAAGGDTSTLAPGEPGSTPGEPDRPSAGSSLKLPAYLALGLGVVGVGVGTVFIIGGSSDSSEAENKFNACVQNDGTNDSACNDAAAQREIEALDESAASQQTLAVVGFAVGGAALATGVILLVVDGGKTSEAARRNAPPRVVPQIGLNYVGLSGSF